MGVPAPLSRKLRDKLGSEASEGLVTWLEEMRAEHQEQLARIDARMNAVETRLTERIQGAETRLSDRLQGVEARLTERIHAVEVTTGEVQSNLMKWSFLFWCGAVTAIAALAGVLKAP